MTRALKPREDQLPQVPPEDLGLVGEYDESDFTVPGWFLVQPTSTEFEGVKAGTFATKDGRTAETLRVVILRMAATRALWPREMGEGRRPLCASNDRIEGRPFGEFKPYVPDGGKIFCRECPHYDDTPWNGDAGCYKGYAILFVLIDEDDEPGVIRVKGTSVGPVKQKVLSHFQPRPGRFPMPVWAKVFEFGSEKGESAKGNYFVLNPKLVGDAENVEHYRQLAQHLAGVKVGAVEEEEVPIDDEPIPDDEPPYEEEFR